MRRKRSRQRRSRQAEEDEMNAYLEKTLGTAFIESLNKPSKSSIEVIPTGSDELDHSVLQIGGLPRGRIVELYGPESAGKTTLALHVIAECQRLGGVCAFIDADHALDLNYAQKIGVRIEGLILSRPQSGEEAFAITEELLASGGADIVVVDSLAALPTSSEEEYQSEMIESGVVSILAVVQESAGLVILINQIRSKVDAYGDPATTAGEPTLQRYSSIRMRLSKAGLIYDGHQVVGSRSHIQCVQNKLAAPFKEALLTFSFCGGMKKKTKGIR